MRSLACWIGRHTWTTHVDYVDEYVCSRCGKVRVLPSAEARRLADELSVRKDQSRGGV
jgi:hypothetical protein